MRDIGQHTDACDDKNTHEAAESALEAHEHEASSVGRNDDMAVGERVCLPVPVVTAIPPAVREMQDRGPQSALEWFFARVDAELPSGYQFNNDTQLIFQHRPGGRPLPICGPLIIEAMLRNPDGGGWAWRIRFIDRDMQEKSHVISATDLAGNQRAVSVALMDSGLDIRARPSVFAELISNWQTPVRIVSTAATGWFDGGEGGTAFVLPDGKILTAPGGAPDLIEFLGLGRANERPGGTLEGWQNGVARLASGNPALMFAISTAMSGPLLRLAGIDTLGFNLFGQTSCGKTHALKVGVGVWRDPHELVRWNATATGLELLCEESNDGLLALDEFPASVDRMLTATLYSIGNGTGKLRGSRDLSLRMPARWRTALLSTSEKSISQVFAATKSAMPEGLSVRLIDVPARSWDHGMFQTLHGNPDGHSFSQALAAATSANFGHAGQHFVSWILSRKPQIEANIAALVERYRSMALRHIGLDAAAASGPVLRVLERFAVVAATGELGILSGVLPWPKYSAGSAALEIAELWHNAQLPDEQFGTRESLAVLRGFLHEGFPHRFTDLDGEDRTRMPLRPAGWFDSRWIYVDSVVFGTEVATDRLPGSVARHLAAAGVLSAGGESRSLQFRLPGTRVASRPRVYRLDRAALGLGGGSS